MWGPCGYKVSWNMGPMWVCLRVPCWPRAYLPMWLSCRITLGVRRAETGQHTRDPASSSMWVLHGGKVGWNMGFKWACLRVPCWPHAYCSCGFHAGLLWVLGGLQLGKIHKTHFGLGFKFCMSTTRVRQWNKKFPWSITNLCISSVFAWQKWILQESHFSSRTWLLLFVHTVVKGSHWSCYQL